jgi:hypothetical protein
LATWGDLVKMHHVSYGLFTESFLEELNAFGARKVQYGLPEKRARELEREARRR